MTNPRLWLALFQPEARRVFAGHRNQPSPFAHSFGGSHPYEGLRLDRKRPPVHLLFRLDASDPAVGVRLPNAKFLPLLCAIRYGACHLGYRVVSDDRVEVLYQSDLKPWKR